MIDKRVDQIEEERWRKLDQDFAEFHENERQMRNKKWEEKYAKELEEKRQQGLEEGFNQGRQEGFNQGRQEGLNQGRQEGLNQGLNQGVIQTIRQLSKSLSVVQIAHALEISEEQVKEYLKQ